MNPARKLLRWFSVAGAAALLHVAPACAADGFAVDLTAPNVHISIPNLPNFPLARHPFADTQPHLRLMGSSATGVTVSVLMPTAAPGMTPVECAASSLASTVRRFKLARDDYVAAKLDDSTFALLFIVRNPEFAQLETYLFSAAGGTHCVEVHASKMTRSSDDVVPWRQSFEGASITQP